MPRAHIAYTPPLAREPVFGFLERRALPGVEEVVDGIYRRVLQYGDAIGVVSARIADDGPRVELELDDALVPARAAILAGARRVFDTGADPAVIDAALARDPRLAPLVAARPGMRVSGTFDGFEIAVRAVLGQQISVAAARTIASRLALRLGAPLPEPDGALRVAFPAEAAVAAADPAGFGIPLARGVTLVALARAICDGLLDLRAGADPAAAREALLALPGIGPWTASYIAMRAFDDRDAFLESDLVLRQVLGDTGLASVRDVARRSEQWRPWRAYAVVHLWAEAAERRRAR
jgi:AraC family transcriptional regulator of adaptative response / DNA-3-methyladenine glycosylase II